MNFTKSFVMTLVLVMPFLCADLYTKYLAHTELPHEGDTFVVTDHIYAINPLRNYGTWWEGELDKDKAHHFTHALIILWSVPLTIMAGFWAAGFVRKVFWSMVLAGVLGNSTEFIIWGGVTDFIRTRNTGMFLDNFVFNLADAFVIIPTGLLALYLLFLLFLWDVWQDNVNWFCGTFLPSVRSFIRGDIEYFSEPPKYTKALTQEITRRYKAGESMEDIAEYAGKTVASIRGKLVSEKVYSQFKTMRLNAMQRGNSDPDTTLVPLQLTRGQEQSFEDLLSYLNDAGYLRVTTVREQGNYSVNGGLVSVHPFGSGHSISLDYFGDIIETITDDRHKSDLPSATINPFCLNGA